MSEIIYKQNKDKYKQYALYKGDKFITIGSIPEMAEELNLNQRTLRWYGSPASRKMNKGNAKILVIVE